jgi:hypothetical protein
VHRKARAQALGNIHHVGKLGKVRIFGDVGEAMVDLEGRFTAHGDLVFEQKLRGCRA